MEEKLIAPCGMNCGICLAYLREKKHCPGCHSEEVDKLPHGIRCIIRNCEAVKASKSGFCFECKEYPCRRLRQLDKRYRTRYAMSMLENLESIRKIGLPAFVEKERQRWRCPKCGGIICVHRGYCYDCGEKFNPP
jgi:hypothetical protein